MEDGLLKLLNETYFYLEKSHDSVWSAESVDDMKNLIKKSIEQIQNNKELDLNELQLAFLPTSYLQEISMENGWSEQYLNISSKIDRFID